MATSPSVDRSWFIVERWQEYEGEARANQLRVVSLAAFYAVEMLNYYGLHLGFLDYPQLRDRPYHLAVTFLVLAWGMLALGIYVCRTQHIVPRFLKYIATAADLVLLTTILGVGTGPRSPLLVGYFLILAWSALRFSLPLIRFATAGAVVGYLVLLGYASWFAKLHRPEVDLSTPRHQQLIFLLALTITGVVLGQVIRRVRGIAEDYARRLPASKGGEA